MALDPDRLLQRLIDATAAELRRLRANVKANANGTLYSPDKRDDRGAPEVLLTNQRTCPMCIRDFGMTDSERRWLVEAGKLVYTVAFGARKLVADKLLKSLSEGQLGAFVDGMAQREKEGKWLPDV